MKIDVKPPQLELCKRLVEVAKAKGVELPDSKQFYQWSPEYTRYIIFDRYLGFKYVQEYYMIYSCDEILAMLESMGILIQLRTAQSVNLAEIYGEPELSIAGDNVYEGSTPIEALYNLLITVLEAR